MKSALFILLLSLMTVTARANEVISIKTVGYLNGLAYKAAQPASRVHFQGVDLSKFIKSSECFDAELINTSAGKSEWTTSWTESSNDIAASTTTYKLTLIKDRYNSLRMVAEIYTNGVKTISKATAKRSFYESFTGSTFDAILYNEPVYDRIQVTPTLLVKSCD